jgi:hypothetical protein
MDEKGKLHLLSQLAHALNQADITWALGASCFLYLKGLVPTFHDLDFFVKEEDAPKAEAIFLSRGKKQPEHYDRSRYGTHLFEEFVIEGVDIDLMASFSIIKDGKEYSFPLEKKNIVEFLTVEGEKVPVESLESWEERYALMGREGKAQIIRAALKR